MLAPLAGDVRALSAALCACRALREAAASPRLWRRPRLDASQRAALDDGALAALLRRAGAALESFDLSGCPRLGVGARRAVLALRPRVAVAAGGLPYFPPGADPRAVFPRAFPGPFLGTVTLRAVVCGTALTLGRHSAAGAQLEPGCRAVGCAVTLPADALLSAFALPRGPGGEGGRRVALWGPGGWLYLHEDESRYLHEYYYMWRVSKGFVRWSSWSGDDGELRVVAAPGFSRASAGLRPVPLAAVPADVRRFVGGLRSREGVFLCCRDGRFDIDRGDDAREALRAQNSSRRSTRSSLCLTRARRTGAPRRAGGRRRAAARRRTSRASGPEARARPAGQPGRAGGRADPFHAATNPSFQSINGVGDTSRRACCCRSTSLDVLGRGKLPQGELAARAQGREQS